MRLEIDDATQSRDEMIASVRRGVWVNRPSNVVGMNCRTLLLTGTTRDGTFLIENGEITKPIKNLRFTESPFFVLNCLEMRCATVGGLALHRIGRKPAGDRRGLRRRTREPSHARAGPSHLDQRGDVIPVSLALAAAARLVGS